MATAPSALEFDGVDEYASIWNSATIKNLSTFTFWCWVKPRSITDSTAQIIWMERQGTGQKIRFAATAYTKSTASRKSYLRFFFGPKDGVDPVSYAYPFEGWGDDRWHHIGFNATLGSTPPVYEILLDGTRVATGNLTLPSGTTAISNTDPIAISAGVFDAVATRGGTVVRKAGTFWNGKLADVLIYNTKKVESDARAYIGQLDFQNISDAAILYNFRFTEGTGENAGPTTTAERRSGNNSTLYINGTATALDWTLDRPFIGSGLQDTTKPVSFTTTGTTNITSTGFTAGWNATTDDVYVQYYELQVATVSNFSSYSSFNAGRATSYKVTGQTSGTNLYWRVRAFDAASNASSYTATVSLTTSATGDLTPPSTPVQNAVTSLSFSGYTANWSAASDNVAVTGYKLDVSTDPYFNYYLTGFRNRDVGNVLTYAITGTNGTQNYWSRVRAYDAVGNESLNSNSIKTKTSPPPDTIAPDVVLVAPATSLSYNSFTANWYPGVDNVGVVGYQLDVSIDPLFGSFLSGFNSLALGNVLGYGITGLTPETVYYYRVRAVDAASNVSSSPDTAMVVTTLPASIAAGAPITSYYSAVQDGYVDSALATTNFVSATTLYVAGNGTTATKLTYFEFDLTGSVGQVISASLFLYCLTAPSGPITITGPTSVITIDETTLTYNTRPSLTGATTAFTPLTNNTGYLVDITSLLTLGNVAYTIGLSTTSNTTFTIASAEDPVNPVPQLEVSQDPSVNTQVMAIGFTPLAGQRTNFCKNPSAETDTSSWSATSTGGAISRITSISLVGSACFQVTGTGSNANQGIITNGNMVPALVGQTWTITFWARVASGTLAVNAAVQENDNTGTQITTTPTAFTLDTTWKRFRITRTLTSGSVAYVGFWLYSSTLVAFTAHLDAVLIEKIANSGSYFDGNTSGAAWTGTANVSTSTLGAAEFIATASYLGDSNGNNSGYFMFKRSDAAFSDWKRHAFIDTNTVNNRGAKQISATIGPSYGNVNAIRNPSFELSTMFWSATGGTGITLNQGQNFVFGNAGMDITYDGSSGARVFSYQPTDASMMATIGDTWTGSIYVFVPAGTPAVTLIITEYPTITAHASSSFVLSPGWQRISFTTTLTNSATMSVIFSVAYTGPAIVLSVDGAMMEKSAFLNPYLDGDQLDGMWESTPHQSVSGTNLSPLTSYDVEVTVTDSDGVINSGTDPTIGTFADSTITSNIPLNPTTSGILTLTPFDNYIEASVTYLGDDNNNNSILFEWRRSDLTNWTQSTVSYDRVDKIATTLITNLSPGIAYVVRATFTDADNVSGTYGINPLVANVNTSTTGSVTAGSTLITFGGFVLMDGSDTQGVIGVTQHDAFGMPDRRITTQDLSRLDGAVETMNLWGTRTINMAGYITGVDRASVYNNLSALKRALAPARQPLVINTFSQNGRYYTASLQSFATAEVAGVNLIHMTWSAVFMCADPFAYDTDLQTTSFSATTGNTISVNNLGDLSVDTLITITTTNASTPLSLTITNQTTGERVTPLVTILNVDTLVIDGQKVSVTKNGIEVDYAGSPPRLVTGSNTLLFTINAGSVNVVLSWRQKYL